MELYDTTLLNSSIRAIRHTLQNGYFCTTWPVATIDKLKTAIEQLGAQAEIDNRGIVRSLVAKLNVAQELMDKGKIEEAKSILEEDFIPQVRNLTSVHITVEAADLLIESAEYIVSHL